MATMGRSEFKFLSISLWDTLDVLFIWFCTGFGRHFKDFKKHKEVFMKKVSSKFSTSNFFTFMRGAGCGLQAMGHGLFGLGCGMQVTRCSLT